MQDLHRIFKKGTFSNGCTNLKIELPGNMTEVSVILHIWPDINYKADS